MQEYEERGQIRLWLLQAAFSLDLTSASPLPFSPLLPAPRVLDSPISPLQESFGQEGPWSHTQRARTRYGWDLLGTGTLALGSQLWGCGVVSWAPFPSWPGAGGSKAHLQRQARRPGSCSPGCCRPCTRTSCCVPRSQWPAGSGRSPCGRAFGSGPQGSGRPGPALGSYHIWEEQNVAQSFRVPGPCPSPCAQVRKATRARLPVRVAPALHPRHIGLGVP